jgi:hypothetical protein
MSVSMIPLESAVAQRVRSMPPWTGDDLVRLLVTNSLGLVLIGAGSIEATGSGSVKTNVAWLNLALLGLIVSGVGNGLWLLRGRQAITSARVTVLPGLTPAAARGGTYDDDEISLLVSGSGLTHFHKAGCALADGRSSKVASRGEHEAAGLAPCEVCNP